MDITVTVETFFSFILKKQHINSIKVCVLLSGIEPKRWKEIKSIYCYHFGPFSKSKRKASSQLYVKSCVLFWCTHCTFWTTKQYKSNSCYGSCCYYQEVTISFIYPLTKQTWCMNDISCSWTRVISIKYLSCKYIL